MNELVNEPIDPLDKEDKQKEASLNITEAGREIVVHKVPFLASLKPKILDMYVKNDILHVAVEQNE